MESGTDVALQITTMTNTERKTREIRPVREPTDEQWAAHGHDASPGAPATVCSLGATRPATVAVVSPTRRRIDVVADSGESIRFWLRSDGTYGSGVLVLLLGVRRSAEL